MRFWTFESMRKELRLDYWDEINTLYLWKTDMNWEGVWARTECYCLNVYSKTHVESNCHWNSIKGWWCHKCFDLMNALMPLSSKWLTAVGMNGSAVKLRYTVPFFVSHAHIFPSLWQTMNALTRCWHCALTLPSLQNHEPNKLPPLINCPNSGIC